MQLFDQTKHAQTSKICTEKANSSVETKFTNNGGQNITLQLLFIEELTKKFKNFSSNSKQEICTISYHSFQES